MSSGKCKSDVDSKLYLQVVAFWVFIIFSFFSEFVLSSVLQAVLVHRSLHVLHVLLEHICGVENIPEARYSLFVLMNQIASRRTEEDVKLEALSIMNIIVMSTDAYTQREA